MSLKETINSLDIPAQFKLGIAQTVLKLDEVAADLNLSSLYLFGSCARGEALPGSDIDILLVTKKSEREVYENPRFWLIDNDTSVPPIQLTARKLDILTKDKSDCEFNNAIKKDMILLRMY